MKFEIQNLGTIKRTTLDLRPLTVIIGPNNTNKTYLAYCVHGLLKYLGAQWGDSYGIGPGKRVCPLKLHDVTAATQTFATSAAREFTETLAEHFQDTYGGLFASTKLGIHLEERDVIEALRIVEASPESKARVALNGDQVEFTVDPNYDISDSKLLARLGAILQPCLARAPITLPAERNAFIITYKMLSARRFRVLRDRERSLRAAIVGTKALKTTGQRELALLREQGDIRYPTPIEDFLDFLTDVELTGSVVANHSSSPFGKLARAIETHLQGGHRTGYEATRLGGRELALTISDELRVDMYNASSSIKQIAPLLLYLRYRAQPRQMLIIDEPEMNLHPEGQAKLLEALAMLANLGVHVLLTTHSPYFMAHLNNLIAADATSSPRKKRQARHLYMADPAAFLSPDDVSACEMRPEGLVSLADPEYGIRWDTLSDVSAELQRRYFAIIEEPERRGKARS